MIRYRIRNDDKDLKRLELQANIVAENQPNSTFSPIKAEIEQTNLAKGQKRSRREARKPNLVKPTGKGEASVGSVDRQTAAGMVRRKPEK